MKLQLGNGRYNAVSAGVYTYTIRLQHTSIYIDRGGIGINLSHVLLPFLFSTFLFSINHHLLIMFTRLSTQNCDLLSLFTPFLSPFMTLFLFIFILLPSMQCKCHSIFFFNPPTTYTHTHRRRGWVEDSADRGSVPSALSSLEEGKKNTHQPPPASPPTPLPRHFSCLSFLSNTNSSSNYRHAGPHPQTNSTLAQTKPWI